jgi:hypothetical protein
MGKPVEGASGVMAVETPDIVGLVPEARLVRIVVNEVEDLMTGAQVVIADREFAGHFSNGSRLRGD